VEWIENYAFYGCTGFSGKLTLPKNLKTIGTHAFRDCKFTGELSLPEGLSTIGIFAFSGCDFTGTLKLPQTLTLVARSAFRECNFSEAVFHSEVSDIGPQAFYGCNSLTDVYFDGDAPEIVAFDSEDMGSFPGDVTLYCKTTAEGWMDSAYYDAERGFYKGYRLDIKDGAEKFTLTAFVTAYNPALAAEITLERNGEAVYTYKIESSSGNGLTTQKFSITDVVEGKYDLVLTKKGHLSYTVKGITVDCDVELGSMLELVAGDVNGDGCIDLKDVAALTSVDTYGLSVDEAKTASADVNGDGCFDLSDLSIITSEKNYGRSPTVVEYEK